MLAHFDFGAETDRWVRSGSTRNVRNLVALWKRCRPDEEGRRSPFLARLEEMERIEAEHGPRSLFIVPVRSREAADLDPAKIWLRRSIERSDTLRSVMGKDWWNWAHRSCVGTGSA